MFERGIMSGVTVGIPTLTIGVCDQYLNRKMYFNIITYDRKIFLEICHTKIIVFRRIKKSTLMGYEYRQDR